MSWKQAINDKLQGSVATYIRCDGVVNKKIRKVYCWVWAKKIKNQWIFRKVTSKILVISCTFRAWPTHWQKAKKVHETITFLLVTLSDIYRLKKFTRRLNNKPFLIRLLTTPPHFEYIATLPCKSVIWQMVMSIVVSLWPHFGPPCTQWSLALSEHAVAAEDAPRSIFGCSSWYKWHSQ